MTGTADTEAFEFNSIYQLEVIVIPTNKPMIRKDLPDVVYKTEKEKINAVIEKIKECYQRGQPILVGTRSIEKNEYLSGLLEKEGIPHQVLNAKNHQREGEIIAQAGKLQAVVVATNMAGRGVDIILGGNPPDKKEAEKVKELGGLFVLGTERHEARRIDDQLRGRAGRQGDPGVSQFFLSLEDDLLRIFGGERVKKLMERLKIPQGQPIESRLITNLIESAQRKIEGLNFDLRKHLLEYDNVMNIHRETFYKKRREILEASKETLQEKIFELLKEEDIPFEKIKEKEKEFGQEEFWEIVRLIFLRVMDNFWINHLEEMEYLKDKVRLKAYGQIDPLLEYKNQGYLLFKNLLSSINKTVIQNILVLSKELKKEPPKEEVFQKALGRDNPLKKKPKRNEPCPCGSGKKYKKCCWPKYG